MVGVGAVPIQQCAPCLWVVLCLHFYWPRSLCAGQIVVFAMGNGEGEVVCCDVKMGPTLLGRSSVPVIGSPPLLRTGRVGGVEMRGDM